MKFESLIITRARFIRVMYSMLMAITFISLMHPTFASAANDVAETKPVNLDKNGGETSLAVVPKPFLAEYKVYYKWLKVGRVSYDFSEINQRPAFTLPASDTKFYRFALHSKMRFLLFSDQRSVRSDFYIQQGLLYPYYYYNNRQGSGNDYNEFVKIDWQSREVEAKFLKREFILDLNSTEASRENQAAFNSYQHVLDGLAVQFQLFLDIRQQAQTTKFVYPIIEPYGLMERSFEFVERQTIELKINGEKRTLDCVVYKVSREQKKYRTLMYFAQQLGFLPVQLVHYSNDKKQFSAVLFDFKEGK